MSGAALAKKPPNAPRVPATRKLTAKIADNPYAFEPLLVRGGPPGAGDPDYLAFSPLSPMRAGNLGDQTLDARLDGQMDGQMDDQLDDRLDDQQDEALDKKRDEKAAGAKDGAEGEGGVGDAIDAAVGFVGGLLGLGGRKRGKKRPARKARDEGPEIEDVPQPVTGPVQLDNDPLRLTAPASTFTGPLALTVKPQKRADGPKGKPDKDVDIYLAVFAEAAAAARRLHDGLMADAARAVSAARQSASDSSDRRQGELRTSLADLDDGLRTARQILATRVEDALALVDQRAAAARAQIGGAAKRANGALTAANARVVTGKKAADDERKVAEDNAKAYSGSLKTKGAEAIARMEKFKADPAATFPYPADAIGAAANEAVVERAPKRAEHRIEAYGKELKAQTSAMTSSFDRLPSEFKKAFEKVDHWIAQTSKAGPAAVASAKSSALDQLSKTRRQVRESIRAGRARTEVQLIRQHEAARKQTIIAHRSRAKSEAMAESRRGEQDVTTLKALALAQSVGTRAIADSLAKQVDKGESAYAKAVISTARGFASRIAETDSGQRRKLGGQGAQGRASLARQSEAAGARLVEQSDNVARQLVQAAQDGGDGLFSQANESSSSFDKMAQPVAKSMTAYLPPIGKAFDEEITKLNGAVADVKKSIESYMETGKAGSGKKEGDGQGGDTKSADKSDPPKMLPNEFIGMVSKVAADPKTDTQIADLKTKADVDVPKLIETKATAIWDNISELGTNVEGVLSALRSITARQGAAIKVRFRTKYGGRDVETYIRFGLPKMLSADSTNSLNVEAAINYLNGNNIAGALADLKAAVNYSNEEARVEKIQRSLSPADWGTLKALHGGDIKDVRDDLDGVDQQVFDSLSSESGFAAQGKALNALGFKDEQTGKGVAKANALRLREKMGRDRDKMGDAGADDAADSVENAALNAGNDVLSGADPLNMDERPIDALDVTDTAKARNDRVWGQTKTAFDKLEDPKGDKAPKDAKAGWSIAAFASQKRDYDVYKPGPDGRYGYWTVEKKGITEHQNRLIQMLVDHPPDSEEVAAARLMVEMNRESGKPKPERVDKAMHAGELDAREGEDKAALTPDEKKKRLDKAKGRQAGILAKVAEFQGAKDGGKGDVEKTRKEITDKLTSGMSADPTAAALVQRSMRGLGKDWDTEQKERTTDATTAFDYANAHEADRAATLKRTFGRMDKSEIDTAVAAWDDKNGGPGALYKKLNLYGKGSWWTESLSGDERNDVELSAMGVARNDGERALIARMRAQQQIRDAGWLGKVAGKVTGDWDRLVESRDQVERLMGLPPDAFDAMGRVKQLGARFDKDGKFIPPPGGSAAELELAMHLTNLSAESYKTMTDKVATAVTTSLVVIAAVVTTALTGGAAASIWIPMLVTAGAGLAGIALSASIKGNRYSRAEMERDLVMTFVQAATAGLGAAAGVALKGGMPAVRAVASRAMLSEKVLERFIAIGGRQAMSKGWTLVAEIGIGAGTNAINSAAGAAMDPANRAKGQSGTRAFEAGMKGLLSGAAGAALLKPASALGGKMAGGYGQRALGSAVSSVGSKATEIGFDHATGIKRVGNTNDVADELKTAAATSLIQAGLEEKAGRMTDARRARAAEARKAARQAQGEPAAPQVQAPEPASQRPPPAAEAEANAAPKPTAHPDAQGPTTPQVPAQEPIHLPLPPDIAPLAEPAKALRPDDLPPVTNEPTTVPPPAPEHAAPPRPGASGADDIEPPTQRKPPKADDEPATQRKPTREEAAGPGGDKRRKPPPLPGHDPHADIPWAAPDFLEGAVMLDADPKNRAEVDKGYRATIKGDPSREVAIYRNPVTGEHVVIFGDADSVFIGLNKDTGEGPMPAGMKGKAQQWKEMLPKDVGRWELEAHYHPGYNDQHDTAPMARRLPSTGENGIGDFAVLKYESGAAGGQPRESVIHWTHEGREGQTIFGHNPNSTTERYWLSVENPATGKHERRAFPDVAAYEAWAAKNGARTNRDAAPAPGGGPKPGSGGADETLSIRHGTTRADAEAMAGGGINPHRKDGKADDFGRGFYVTLDDANAQHYANTRADQHPDRGGPAVLSTSVKLSDFDLVVDVREGGRHRAEWDAFLDQVPAAYPPGGGAGVWKTAREYAENRGKFSLNEIQRGVVFEAFLKAKGLGHADVVRGDLGKDPLTGGISAKGGGEQIAIRSKKAANLLNERMGFPLLPEDTPAPPVRPGSAKSAEAEVAPAGGAKANIPERTAVEHFVDTHPDGGKLKALFDLEPELVARALEGGKLTDAQRKAVMETHEARAKARAAGQDPDAIKMPPMSEFILADLREARVAAGDTPAAADAHVEALRAALRTPEQRIIHYHDKVMAGEITPEPLQKWMDDEAKKPGFNPESEAYKAQLKAQREAAVDAYRRDVAAPEKAAWSTAADKLDAAGAAAIARSVDQDVIDRYRALKPTKGDNPQRDAFRALDAADPALLTDIVRKATGNPRTDAALVTEWRMARAQAGVDPRQIASEAKALWTVLKNPELRTKLETARQIQKNRNITAGSLTDMVLADPTLLALARTDPDLLLDRYAAMMTRDEKNNPARKGMTAQKTMTGKDLADLIEAHMVSSGKPMVSEATATFNVTKQTGADVIQASSMTSGKANAKGIDLAVFMPPAAEPPGGLKATVTPSPAGEPAPPKVKVMLVDDKAVASEKQSDVTALTKNLSTNMKTMADEHIRVIDQRRAAGLDVDPGHEAAVRQMAKAAAEIDAIPAALKKVSKTKGSGDYPHQSMEYAAEVARILKENGIELHVTSEYGQVETLPDWLKAYGFRVWDKPNNRPGPAPVPPPPPPAPPVPPPGP